MFDLFRSRDKVVRFMLGFILIVVAASMCVYLIPGSNPGTAVADETVLAQLGNDKLTQQEFQQHFQILLQGANINDPSQIALMYPQYMQQEIVKMALLYVAKQMGLTVTDDEVLTGVESQWPQFFQNGQVNRDQFQQYLASIGLTEQEATDTVRDQLIIKRLEDATLAGVVVTDAEVKGEFARRYDKAKISYIKFPAGKFTDQVKPTDKDLQDTYTLHKDSYPVPAKNNYQVLVVDQNKVAAGMTVTDAQLRQAYTDSMDNFRTPERIHVRHILISTEGKSDAEKKALKAKAEDILKQLKNGADFAELAKKDSDDKGSGEKGGDLDWIVKGQMQVPEFEAAAFSLKPMELSPVVTSSLGYHIIQVLAKEPASVKPFDEVKGELADELKKEGLGDKVQMIADQVHDALVKSPGSADQIAKQYGVDLITVPDGVAGQAIPNLGVSPEIDAAVSQLGPNQVSDEISLPSDRLAVVVLKSRTPARLATFDEVKDQIRQTFIQTKAQDIAAEKAKEAAERLKKGEDMSAVAKSYKLDVTTSSMFGSADSVEGLGQAFYVADAFTKPIGSILGPTPINGAETVSKVLEQQRGDPSLLAAQRQQIIDALKKQKASADLELLEDSTVTNLINSGKMKRNDKAINELASTYGPHPGQ
jgi:peptidyl-prolyl cis-trans isomerase D